MPKTLYYENLMGEIVEKEFTKMMLLDRLMVKNLRYLMREKNVSESQLSRCTGIPQPTLHKILSGKTIDPRISTVRVLADYFDMTMDSLYSNECTYSCQVKIPGKYIPLLTWSECVQYEKLSEAILNNAQHQWILSDHLESTFALISERSMEPYFQFGTLLIIGQSSLAEDGDYVIINRKSSDGACIRRKYLNGSSNVFLQLDNRLKDRYDNNQDLTVIGTLLQARIDYVDLNIRGLK